MKLSDYLTANAISNRAFADKIGVSAEAVRLYAAGDRQPRVGVMRMIIEQTGGAVGPQDFFDAASNDTDPTPQSEGTAA